MVCLRNILVCVNTLHKGVSIIANNNNNNNNNNNSDCTYVLNIENMPLCSGRGNTFSSIRMIQGSLKFRVIILAA
jgi:hypothetical protein